jgi:hypothetical protein
MRNKGDANSAVAIAPRPVRKPVYSWPGLDDEDTPNQP